MHFGNGDMENALLVIGSIDGIFFSEQFLLVTSAGGK